MNNGDFRLEVPTGIQEDFQGIADILAETIGIPAALIMRYTEPHIEVFISSNSDGNPYTPGDKETLSCSGLYCEMVIRSQDKLLVPNALANPAWESNPDVKLNMISYLGFPILLPDKKPFGTLCVLDNKPNEYSTTIEKLLSKFRNLIESHLEMSYMNQVLGDENKRVTDYLYELQALRGIVPICTHCRSIKDAQNNWHPIEHFLDRNPESNLSHGICTACMARHYPDVATDR